MDIEQLAKTTFLVSCAAGWEQKAKDELRGPLHGPQVRALFLRGNLLLTCDDDQATALELLANLTTECVGHITPLHVRCAIGKGCEHLETLACASDLLPGPSAGAPFRAVCNRRGDHEWTSQQAAMAVGVRVAERTGAPVSLEAPEQVVMVEVFQDFAFLGVAWNDELVRKEITRMRKYAPGTRPLNRAELKLREIITQFELALPPAGRALDIGAAPGGWTKVLAEHVAEVVAVDPAVLDATVVALPNVRHLPLRSERLDEVGDLGLFDVVTDDMNMDPDASARVLCELAPLVRPGGTAVMTVKFVTRHRRELVQAALDVLAACYEEPRVGRVPHNAMETTVVTTRRAEPAHSPR